ncbi:MAG TPA: ankyrin repeat domain-containing protein [Vicinamibacterales bacterium]|nr:ankyrin repeat domain-containing protein [Vicinamibacterales bacterium]
MASLHRSKQDAKTLLRRAQRGDAASIARIATALASVRRRRAQVTLADAQFTIARERGFASWAALKRAAGAHRPRVSPALVRDWLFAAERGDLAALERMYATEPRLLDALGQGPYWVGEARALHYAVSRGHRRVVRWLLARGSSARPVAGEFDWAPLHFAAVPPRPALVALLVKHGATMDIFTAAVLGDVRLVRQMLRQDPGLVASRGPDGATPLHFAGSPAVARALLAAGADPNQRDTFHHSTPAEWTTQRPDIVRVIANAGAGIDIFVACAIGDLRRVKALVRDDPGILEARVGKDRAIGAEGETPLAIAARHGRGNIVAFLLAHGAHAAATPSILPGAVHRGDRGIVRHLIAAGADPNAFGPHGHAALHIAAVYGKMPMIRLLVAHGARFDLKDRVHDGTPYDWAVYHKHPRAAAYLKTAAGS